MTGKSRHDFGHGDARYITYLNVFSQPLLNDQIELGLTPIDRKQTEVKSGDALFTISSEVPEEIAISAVWQSTRENVYLNSFCFGVRPYRSCDSVYFAYALRSPSVRVSFMLLAQGISRYNISKLRALDVLLPWPSEDEQNNVGSFFARADRLIALHQRKLEKLQRMKQALLEKLFPKNGAVVPELRFNGFTDAWEQRKLEQISTRVTSIGHDLSLPRIEYEDIVARRGELKKEIAKNISLKIGILFAPGDVLYGKLRPYLMHWLHPQFSGVAVGDFWVFRPTSTDSSFFYCLIQSEQFQQAAAVSIGSKMPRADWKYVSEFPYLVPKQIHEQQNIGLLFEGLELYIALHQRKLEKLQQLKSAFLTKMFV